MFSAASFAACRVFALYISTCATLISLSTTVQADGLALVPEATYEYGAPVVVVAMEYV